METVAADRRRILLTTVSSDSHMWNLIFLQLLLEEHGHEVTNLGPCVPDALVLETADQIGPDVIVVSSVNGHGHLDGLRLVRALRTNHRTYDIPAMIGGKLGVGGDNKVYARALTEAGFDKVFTDDGDIDALVRSIRELPVRSARLLTSAV